VDAVDHDDDGAAMRGGVLILRTMAVLVRASPVAFGAALATAALQGVGPNVVTLAGARVVGLAPQLGASAAARHTAVTALVVLGGALLVERVAAALAPVTTSYLIFRFSTALDRMRIASCLDLPGLEHFESAALADRLEAASWSKSGPPALLERLITLVRRGTMLVGSLLILTRLAWWAPLIVSVTAIGIGVNDWRHAGKRATIVRQETGRLRFADYHRQLAVEPAQAREIRLFAIGDWLAARHHRFWAEGSRAVFADLRRQLSENSLLNVVRAATLLVPLVVALVRLHSGSLGTEAFTAVIFALRTSSNGMFVLEGIPGRLRETAVFLPDLFAIAQLPQRDPRLRTDGRAPVPRRLRDGIRFEDVVFRYPGESTAVLDGLTLHLPAGQSLALVGENGAGKSTLVKLLCRFYDPVAGRITVDGVDIRDFDLATLRERIAVVFQDFVKLPVSVRDNLLVATGEPGTAQPLPESARQAGASGLIDALPSGWDTVLSREFGGVELSGGQWQRLALARLLAGRAAHGAPVLILDEPTAALDVRLEAELYEQFEELTRGATTLLISHRFSTVRMADRVAVLERGRIIELGSHDELMDAAGRYAELFTLQARRFQSREEVR
jgi:ABC-type multidrug transport system fused ATPase/permease subunit